MRHISQIFITVGGHTKMDDDCGFFPPNILRDFNGLIRVFNWPAAVLCMSMQLECTDDELANFIEIAEITCIKSICMRNLEKVLQSSRKPFLWTNLDFEEKFTQCFKITKNVSFWIFWSPKNSKISKIAIVNFSHFSMIFGAFWERISDIVQPRKTSWHRKQSSFNSFLFTRHASSWVWMQDVSIISLFEDFI